MFLLYSLEVLHVVHLMFYLQMLILLVDDAHNIGNQLQVL